MALDTGTSYNRVRKSWSNNTGVYGLWMYLPGSALAHTLASSSPQIDFIIIDCEHGLIPLHGSAAETIRAISFSNPDVNKSPVPFVRITAVDDASRSWQIKLALDGGAKGLICPMVSNRASAEIIANWSRFPPIGFERDG